MTLTELGLVVTGFVAGAIDSIAGGGGLITLPVLSEVLEPGAHAIGTNKIVGMTGALIAFLVYLRKQPLNLKKSFLFLIAIGIGSFIGSLCSPLLPKIYFRALLILACPFILWMVWNKQLFIQEVRDHAARAMPVLFVTGAAVGFYDGFFGPGGGTFMLLGLLWAVRLPLFEALLLSKLANTVSAGVALVSYAAQGYVHVQTGLITAVGMTAGGFLGAKLASKKAETIVRPVLLLVVTLLLIVQAREFFVSTPKPKAPHAVVIQADGAWCWFGDNRAVETDQAVYVSSISSKGQIQIDQINRDGSRKLKVFANRISVNDHNNPSMTVLPDGNLILFFSEHNGPTLYISKTTVPGDVNSFAEPVHFGEAKAKGFTYPNIFSRKQGGVDQLVLFYRGSDWSPQMILSKDAGKQWAPAKTLIQTQQRPYAKYSIDGLGRIHMAFTDGHPNYNPSNSIYYMVWDGETFRKANGELIGKLNDLPFTLQQLDQVYHPQQERAWIWSLATDSANRPVAAFSVTNDQMNHRYMYARWNGSVWTKTEITDGGESIQTPPKVVPDEKPKVEHYYSGGVFIDPTDVSRIFVSSERQNNLHSIEEWKFISEEAGVEKVRNISHDSQKAFRPYIPFAPIGLTRPRMFDVLWLTGEYVYYTHFSTRIEGLQK